MLNIISAIKLHQLIMFYTCRIRPQLHFAKHFVSKNISKILLVCVFFTLIIGFSESGIVALGAILKEDNQYLYVSAESDIFDNTFGGPMVVEVMISDSNLSGTDEVKAEPYITVNDKTLRMAQGEDGNWYGYFADRTMATLADQVMLTSDFTDTEGKGLDFGGFCSSTTTDTDIIGTSGGFPETVGFAIAKNTQEDGKSNDNPEVLEVAPTQGIAPFVDCVFIGSNDNPDDPSSYRTVVANHVVRNAPVLNADSAGVNIGQIGLIEDTWPIIQLYDFSSVNDVQVNYYRGGGGESAIIYFDNFENLTYIEFDAKEFPPNAELHLELYDNQLNIDPTSKDSWTFDVTSSPLKVIYQMYDESGSNDGQGKKETEIDIFSDLSNLGYETNGFLEIIPNAQNGSINVVENDKSSLIVGANPKNKLLFPVTLVETEPNSGIFASYDSLFNSNIDISSDAKSGTSATIQYAENRYSVLVKHFDGKLKLGSSLVT